MEIKINHLEKETADFDAFAVKEWTVADKEHYGISPDWKPKFCILEAKIGENTVGILKGKVILGVCEVDQILVACSKRRQSIGKKLMAEAEQFARSLHAHKMYLITGKNWEARDFYQALGYSERGFLGEHYMKKDFVVLEKFL